MSSLFIVNSVSALEQCLPALSADDGLLLIEDAVSACLNVELLRLSNNPSNQYFVLEEDCIARGILNAAQSSLRKTVSSKRITFIDYPKFVELSLQYDKAVSWL